MAPETLSAIAEAQRKEQLHTWLRAHGKPVAPRLAPDRAAQLKRCFEVIDGARCPRALAEPAPSGRPSPRTVRSADNGNGSLDPEELYAVLSVSLAQCERACWPPGQLLSCARHPAGPGRRDAQDLAQEGARGGAARLRQRPGRGRRAGHQPEQLPGHHVARRLPAARQVQERPPGQRPDEPGGALRVLGLSVPCYAPSAAHARLHHVLRR